MANPGTSAGASGASCLTDVQGNQSTQLETNSPQLVQRSGKEQANQSTQNGTASSQPPSKPPSERPGRKGAKLIKWSYLKALVFKQAGWSSGDVERCTQEQWGRIEERSQALWDEILKASKHCGPAPCAQLYAKHFWPEGALVTSKESHNSSKAIKDPFADKFTLPPRVHEVPEEKLIVSFLEQLEGVQATVTGINSECLCSSVTGWDSGLILELPPPCLANTGHAVPVQVGDRPGVGPAERGDIGTAHQSNEAAGCAVGAHRDAAEHAVGRSTEDEQGGQGSQGLGFQKPSSDTIDNTEGHPFNSCALDSGQPLDRLAQGRLADIDAGATGSEEISPAPWPAEEGQHDNDFAASLDSFQPHSPTDISFTLWAGPDQWASQFSEILANIPNESGHSLHSLRDNLQPANEQTPHRTPGGWDRQTFPSFPSEAGREQQPNEVHLSIPAHLDSALGQCTRAVHLDTETGAVNSPQVQFPELSGAPEEVTRRGLGQEPPSLAPPLNVPAQSACTVAGFREAAARSRTNSPGDSLDDTLREFARVLVKAAKYELVGEPVRIEGLFLQLDDDAELRSKREFATHVLRRTYRQWNPQTQTIEAQAQNGLAPPNALVGVDVDNIDYLITLSLVSCKGANETLDVLLNSLRRPLGVAKCTLYSVGCGVIDALRDGGPLDPSSGSPGGNPGGGWEGDDEETMAGRGLQRRANGFVPQSKRRRDSDGEQAGKGANGTAGQGWRSKHLQVVDKVESGCASGLRKTDTPLALKVEGETSEAFQLGSPSREWGVAEDNFSSASVPWGRDLSLRNGLDGDAKAAILTGNGKLRPMSTHLEHLSTAVLVRLAADMVHFLSRENEEGPRCRATEAPVWYPLSVESYRKRIQLLKRSELLLVVDSIFKHLPSSQGPGTIEGLLQTVRLRSDESWSTLKQLTLVEEAMTLLATRPHLEIEQIPAQEQRAVLVEGGRKDVDRKLLEETPHLDPLHKFSNFSITSLLDSKPGEEADIKMANPRISWEPMDVDL